MQKDLRRLQLGQVVETAAALMAPLHHRLVPRICGVVESPLFPRPAFSYPEPALCALGEYSANSNADLSEPPTLCQSRLSLLD
jgi:hypothetical protein